MPAFHHVAQQSHFWFADGVIGFAQIECQGANQHPLLIIGDLIKQIINPLWINQMDYVLVMDHGQIVEQGTPAELAAQFAAIDRERMKDNTWLGWLRSLIRPAAGD